MCGSEKRGELASFLGDRRMGEEGFRLLCICGTSSVSKQLLGQSTFPFLHDPA